MPRPHPIVALCLLSGVLGCTSIGFHGAELRGEIDFGPRERVALCVYADDGIGEAAARALVEDAWHDEAPKLGLDMVVVRVSRWSRPAFTVDGLIAALRLEPLAPGCDRLLALVNRHLGDVLWGLLGLPEVLGAVNDETLTHGYAVARWASLNQIFMSPARVVRHELYHMLGCDTHFDMARCYRQIARLKRWRAEHGSTFFPAWDMLNQRVLTSPEEVAARLRAGRTPLAVSAPPPAE